MPETCVDLGGEPMPDERDDERLCLPFERAPLFDVFVLPRPPGLFRVIVLLPRDRALDVLLLGSTAFFAVDEAVAANKVDRLAAVDLNGGVPGEGGLVFLALLMAVSEMSGTEGVEIG